MRVAGSYPEHRPSIVAVNLATPPLPVLPGSGLED